MKNIKKNALKVMVLIALSAPAAFADDGDMPGGGLAANGNGNPSGVVVISQASEGTAIDGAQTAGTSNLDSVLSAIYEYLGLVM